SGDQMAFGVLVQGNHVERDNARHSTTSVAKEVIEIMNEDDEGMIFVFVDDPKNLLWLLWNAGLNSIGMYMENRGLKNTEKILA
ncbi:hypothetical protein ACJX0J_011232, partial [Zea mays]